MSSKEVVVVRSMSAVVQAVCPYCNLVNIIDRSGNFAKTAKFRCSNCGAQFGEYLAGIQPLRTLLDHDDFRDDDITVMMVASPSDNLKMSVDKNEQPNTMLVCPTQSLTMEKSSFYLAEVTCPFCHNVCLTRYNAPEPFLAQYCPEKSCRAELVTTIWAENVVGGDVSGWYKSDE